MTSTATLKWIGLALLGIAVAAAVAFAASNLASQQIGLASEPISAGDALAPTAISNRGQGSSNSGHGAHRPTPTAPTTTPAKPAIPPETTTTPTATAPEDRHHDSGDDHGSGGHGADD